jgi:carbamoyl-phosphate synthase large subunit
MKSTGEGISLAPSYEEAIRKSFHTGLKNTMNRKVVIAADLNSDELSPYLEKAKAEAIYLKENDNVWDIKETLALYNPNQQEEDRKMRETATKNRILTFTEKETLIAFLKSMAVEEWDVQSIEDWHQTKSNSNSEKEVSVL